MAKPLITATELVELLNNGPVTLLDVRYAGPSARPGYDEYLAGHLPGAVYVDMEDALAGPSSIPGGRHPLPDPEAFQAAMRAVGVNDEVPVVIYDDWRSIAAARAWWLLCLHGHQNVRVLDGGCLAWEIAEQPMESGPVAAVPGQFTITGPHLKAIDADTAWMLTRDGVLLDGRPANRFRGEDETIDAKAGHIPGARSFPAVDLVDDLGQFLDHSELEEKFRQVGATEGPVGVYCGSGIQAAHVALAAAVAGLEIPQVYVGSWSDWITDPSRPVTTGA